MQSLFDIGLEREREKGEKERSGKGTGAQTVSPMSYLNIFLNINIYLTLPQCFRNISTNPKIKLLPVQLDF